MSYDCVSIIIIEDGGFLNVITRSRISFEVNARFFVLRLANVYVWSAGTIRRNNTPGREGAFSARQLDTSQRDQHAYMFGTSYFHHECKQTKTTIGQLTLYQLVSLARN